MSIQKKTGIALRDGLLVALIAVSTLQLQQRSHAQNIQSSSPVLSVPLTLSRAIDLALKQNRNIQLAYLGISDSEHKKEIARSSYFPQVKNESSLLHITELAGIDIPAGTFGVPAATGPIPSKTLFIGQGSHTSYTSGTGLSQPITQLLKIHEANHKAAADLAMSKIQSEATNNDVTLKVRQLFYGILVAQLKQEAADAQINAGKLVNQERQDAVTQGRALDVAALESRAALLEAEQSALSQRLQLHDLRLSLNDLLGLPLESRFELDNSSSSLALSIPSRDECLRIARKQSTQIRSAEQSVLKARAGVAAARDEYIPNLTGMARYSYQSGVPLLVHNFGSFGLNFSYDLFDGGRRDAEIKDARTLLSEANLTLAQTIDEETVTVETEYDRIEQLQSMVDVDQEALDVITEAARLADRQFEQTAALASIREEAHAKVAAAKAALLEATLGLSLAQADLKRMIGELPR